jgi:aspartate aminotransferase
VFARTHVEDGFAVHAQTILDAVTPRTRGIIVNSPGNPTGALISEGELRTLGEFAARQKIWLVVDLCYEKLIYDPVPHNLPKVLADTCPEQAVICGSASKAYAMTGWRCGWQIGPKEVIAASNAIQSHSTSNVTSITQKATVAALIGSQASVTTMLDEYRKRRDQLHAWLTADSRLRCRKPAGAFYMFVDISDALSPDGIRTSLDWADALLEEQRVAVTPGEAFDAPGTIRISYATSMELLHEGSSRLLAFVAKHAPQPATAG